ncbi:MAG: UMP kinase [Gammaproteobacteria bacterium]|nr:UMP kinase [Gammaproteobacteria bacterium]
MKYRRITLKLSGEAFSTPESGLIDAGIVRHLATQIAELFELGIGISIVPGGGNVFRGRDLTVEAQDIGINPLSADQIGMLATVMNALVLRDALASMNVQSLLFTPHAINGVTLGFSRHRAMDGLEQGNVLVCAGGTGNPLFTTDTAAALRAIELSSDVVLKATHVDGVYEDDPKTNVNARLFDKLTFEDVIQRDLKVMDLAAFALCRENQMPIIVYNLNSPNALTKIVKGANVGTLICNSDWS